MNRIDRAFERLRASGEVGLFPYLMTSYPDPAACAELLEALASAGADGIELAVPFSDPLADGATIQRAGAVALEHGASVGTALEVVRDFRTRRDTPIVLMSYYNPLLAYGIDRLTREGAEAGIDGLIVPDVPIEEAEPLRAACGERGLHLIPLVAPTSTDARIEQTGREAGGFIYCVALVGMTGARNQLAEELPEFLGRVRAHCEQPLVVGFGISRPEHVRALQGRADGAIVASALVDLIERRRPSEWVGAVTEYMRELKAACSPQVPSGSG